MKIKYSAILALALWLCVVAWVSAMIVAKPTVLRSHDMSSGAAELVQLQQNIAHSRDLIAAVESLGTGRATAVGPVIAPAPETIASTVNPTGTVGVATREVSMIISADGSRRAVVGGRLVQPGSTLADGARIRSIGRDWVRIEDASGQLLTLQLPPPFTIDEDREPRL